MIGDDSTMIVEAQATPRLANKVIKKVREGTDKPITHVVARWATAGAADIQAGLRIATGRGR